MTKRYSLKVTACNGEVSWYHKLTKRQVKSQLTLLSLFLGFLESPSDQEILDLQALQLLTCGLVRLDSPHGLWVLESFSTSQKEPS